MNKKYLLEPSNLKLLKEKVLKAENLLFFLDYDGTLAPFRKDSLKAFILPQIEKSLKLLKAKNNYYLNLVSGRKLSELKKMFYLEKLNYAGSHGLEIDLSFEKELIYPSQNSDLDSQSKKLYKMIKKKYSNLKGLKLEDKGFGIAIHFQSQEKLKEHKAKLDSLFENSAYQLLSGRKVLEIRPEFWDKGKTVDFMTKKIKANYQLNNPLRIYIGDDSTDEDAFEVIKEGISIYVQNDSNLITKAEYYLKDPADTAELLEIITGEI